jgi:hypothetical protein
MKKLVLLLLLGGCCPYERAEHFRVVGSGITEGVTYPANLDELLLYDPDHRLFVWVKRSDIGDVEFQALQVRKAAQK